MGVSPASAQQPGGRPSPVRNLAFALVFSTACGARDGLDSTEDAPLTIPGPGTSLGAAVMPVARFIARPPKAGASDRVILAGTNILLLTDDGGTAGAMTSTPGEYCQLDTAAPQNGYAAIRTRSNTANLGVAVGGPSGAGAWHMFALAYPITAGNTAGLATFMLSGTPGAAINGIGSTSDGHEWWAGIDSPAVQTPYDQALHLYELSSDGGTLVTARRDGGVIATVAGASTLSSGAMGFRGWYPQPDSHGPPDTRIYWAAWFDHELSQAERSQVYRYLGKEYAYRPRRFLAATGDSITSGHIDPVSTTSFLELLQARYTADGEAVYILNEGLSSESTAQIAARSPSSFADRFAQDDFRDEWLIIGGGTNDAALTVTQTYDNLCAVSVATQKLGVRTAIGTLLYLTAPQMTPAAYLKVDALNGLIRANACGADRIVDYYVDPLLATPTVAHFPDNIHPDDAALGAMATVQHAVLQ
jgi:GDSL-like lipase/acylhydrolase family protein